MTDDRIAKLSGIFGDDRYNLGFLNSCRDDLLELCRLARKGRHAEQESTRRNAVSICSVCDGPHAHEYCKTAREIEHLRLALADAIRRPLGVIPDLAVGLLTAAELDAAELRRLTPRNK
jgi:hypothetical protein